MVEPSANPKFQFSIRTLLLATAFVAVVFSNYRAAGVLGFLASVVCSALAAIIFVSLMQYRRGWYGPAVFAGAMFGGTIVAELMAYTSYWGLYRTGPQMIDIDDFFRVFGWSAMIGAIFGGGASMYIVRFILRRLPKCDSSESDNGQTLHNDAPTP